MIYNSTVIEVAFAETHGGCGHYMLLTRGDRDKRDRTPNQDSYKENQDFVRIWCESNLITHIIDIVV